MVEINRMVSRISSGIMNRIVLGKRTILLLVTLICGVVTIVSVYLKWVVVPLYDSYTLSISGWKMIIWSGSIGETYAEPYLILFGGIMILACSLSVLIIYMLTRQKLRITRDLGMGVLLGAGLSFIGVVWFVIRALTSAEEGWLGYGFYICAVATILAVVSSIWNLLLFRGMTPSEARTVKDMISGPLAVMACGLLLLVGLFTTWLSVSSGGIASDTSGWGLTRFNLIGIFNPEPYLVLAGSIIMLACGILMAITEVAFIEKHFPRGVIKYTPWILGGLAYIGGALAGGGALWFAIQAASDIGAGAIGCGIYISVVAAVAGALAGLQTSARTVRLYSSMHKDSGDH